MFTHNIYNNIMLRFLHLRQLIERPAVVVFIDTFCRLIDNLLF